MEIDAQNSRVLKNQKGRLLLKLLKPSTELENTKTVSDEASFEVHELLDSIRNARKEWINANNNFEYANEKEMVDYYTYKIKACEVRYEYLLRKAKEKGVKVELLEMANTKNRTNETEF